MGLEVTLAFEMQVSQLPLFSPQRSLSARTHVRKHPRHAFAYPHAMFPCTTRACIFVVRRVSARSGRPIHRCHSRVFSSRSFPSMQWTTRWQTGALRQCRSSGKFRNDTDEYAPPLCPGLTRNAQARPNGGRCDAPHSARAHACVCLCKRSSGRANVSPAWHASPALISVQAFGGLHTAVDPEPVPMARVPRRQPGVALRPIWSVVWPYEGSQCCRLYACCAPGMSP